MDSLLICFLALLGLSLRISIINPCAALCGLASGTRLKLTFFSVFIGSQPQGSLNTRHTLYLMSYILNAQHSFEEIRVTNIYLLQSIRTLEVLHMFSLR